MRTTISIPGLGHGKQPIPLAVALGPLLVTGNISGVDPETGTRPDELLEEVSTAFNNVSRVLAAAGFDLGAVAKVDVLLADRAHRDLLNEVWVSTYPDEADRPARHTSTGPLPGGLRIQVSVLAYRAEGRA